MRMLRGFVFLAAFLFTTDALAQWQVPQYSLPVGRGSGVTGFAAVGPCATGGVPVFTAGNAALPTCSTVTGAKLGLGTSSFGTSATNVLSQANGVFPGSLTTGVQYTASGGLPYVARGSSLTLIDAASSIKRIDLVSYATNATNTNDLFTLDSGRGVTYAQTISLNGGQSSDAGNFCNGLQATGVAVGFGGFGNVVACNAKGYFNFAGYTRTGLLPAALIAPGGVGSQATYTLYAVGENDYTGGVSPHPSAGAMYAESRSWNTSGFAGSEFDCQAMDLDGRVTNPYAMYGSTTAPLPICLWLSAGGTGPNHGTYSASVGLGFAPMTGTAQFIKGIVFASDAIKTDALTRKQAIAFASGHQLTWCSATPCTAAGTIAGLYSDVSALIWDGAGGITFSGATSGTMTLKVAAIAGTRTITFPAGSTDFSATGGTGQVVKQASAGAAFTVGTVAATELSGTLGADHGGTGVANNASSTLTISGNFATTLTVSGTTGVTLPTSGTLATLAGSEEFTNKTLNASVGKGTWTASGTWTLPAHTAGGLITSTVVGNALTFNGVSGATAGPAARITMGSYYNSSGQTTSHIDLYGAQFGFGVSVTTAASLNLMTGTDGIFSFYSSGAATTPELRVGTGATAGIVVGAPTGTFKGTGTLNIAGAYYANGTVGVTCAAGFSAVTGRSVGGIVTAC